MYDKDKIDEQNTGIKEYKTFIIFLILIIILSFLLYTVNNDNTSEEESITLRYQGLYFEEFEYGVFDVNATLISSINISTENPYIKLYVYDENGTLISSGETTTDSISENKPFNLYFKIEPVKGKNYMEYQANKLKYATFEVYESSNSTKPIIKTNILLLNK